MTDADAGRPGADAGRPGSDVSRVGQRASDLERQAVVDHLRAATAEGRLTLDEFESRVGLVLEARTYEQLAPVTADLPDFAGSPTGIDPAEPPPERRNRRGRSKRRRLVNVFGSARYAGPWEAGRTMTVMAVFGHCHVDLAACRLPPGAGVVELRTIGVFAGVELVVPSGAVVDAGGFAIFGGRHLHHEPVAQTAPALRVRVRSYGMFGGLVVRSGRRVP